MAKQRTDTEAIINLVINGKQAEASMKALTDTQRKLNAEMRNMKPSDPKYDEQLKKLQMVNKALDEQKKKIKGVDDESKKLQSTWQEVTKGIIGGNIAERAWAKVTETITKVVDAYAEAQKNRAVLTNAFNGDADKANKSLKMLMDFASKTPFSMNEAVEGFIKLVNRGIVPTQQEMVKLGDIAASQGKNMDQLIEAVLDAQTGEFERLKEFGIRASKNGDQVAFSFKGVTKEVAFTDEAIKNALLSFGEMPGVANSMKSVSDTIVGLRSNIEDTWDQIYTKIGQGTEGFINGFYRAYAGLLDFVNDVVLSSESAGQRMAKSYADQAREVAGLEKSIKPLIGRYDELKSRSQLNKDEQVELRNVINQIADIMPNAVTQWDKYGNAIDINTKKAKEFIAQQQAMLKFQNKTAVDQLQKEIADMQRQRNNLTSYLNKGQVFLGGAGTGGGGGSMREMNEEERRNVLKSLLDINKRMKENSDAIKGLNGDYLTQLEEKKSAEAKSSARTEGVIKKEIENLEQLRATYDVHSKAYKKYTLDIEKLQKELADARNTGTKDALKIANKEKTAAEKLAEDLEKNAEQIYQNSLSQDEKEVRAIQDKYKKLRERAKGNKDTLVEIQKQEDAEMLQLIKKQGEEALKEREKFDEETKKLQKDEFKKVVDTGENIFTENKAKLDGNYASDLSEVDSEEAAAQLKEAYQQREREMTEEHLLMMKMLYEAYGEDASEIDKKLADARLSNSEREAKGRIAWTEAKRSIDLAYLDLAQQGTATLMGLVNRQSNAYRAMIIIDKALAIAKVIMATQTEIAGYYAKYALIPGGQLLASAEAGAAKIRAGVSIGLIAATGIAEVANSSKDSGDAHASGTRSATPGKKLLGEGDGDELITKNGKWWLTDGPTMANFTGGEKVYNAAETQAILKNNLYPFKGYSVNTTGAAEAERTYRSTSPLAPTNPTDYSEEISLLFSAVRDLTKLQQQEAEKKVVLSYKERSEFDKKIQNAIDRQTG